MSLRDDYDAFMGTIDDGHESGSLWDDLDSDLHSTSPLGSDGDHGYGSEKQQIMCPSTSDLMLTDARTTAAWRLAKTPQEINRINDAVMRQINGTESAQPPKKHSFCKKQSSADSESASYQANAHGDPNSNSAKYARAYRMEKKNQAARLEQAVSVLTVERNDLRQRLEVRDAQLREQMLQIERLKQQILSKDSQGNKKIEMLSESSCSSSEAAKPDESIEDTCARTRAQQRKRTTTGMPKNEVKRSRLRLEQR